jgi:hypothetical protein
LKEVKRVKNKKIIFTLIIITSLILVSINFMNTVLAPVNPILGNSPKMEVSRTSKVAYIDQTEFDTWVYVTNPSRSLDRLMLLPDPPYTEILHTVTINYLKINYIDTDGIEYFLEFYPPEGEPQDWDDYRWDAVVNPRETSLVFYVGFQWTSDVGSVSGLAHFTYLLNCEYEGIEYDLVDTFTIVVRP